VYNACYLAEIYMGTPAQPIRALFDTGSSLSWILSKQNAIEEGFVHSYDHRASSTFHDPEIDLMMFIQFGIGNLSGVFVEDVCMIGDPEDALTQFRLEDFRFGYTLNATVFTGDFEAIIGLAYPGLNSEAEEDAQILPFFDQLMAKNALERNVFSFYMSYNPFDNTDQSEMIFGFIDHSRFVGELHWNPVLTREFWSIKLDEIRYRGADLNICSGP
jgi:cathepsin D